MEKQNRRESGRALYRNQPISVQCADSSGRVEQMGEQPEYVGGVSTVGHLAEDLGYLA